MIYKYEMKVERTFEVEMPLMMTPLHVDVQEGTICLWASVNPHSPQVKRKFYCRGTGLSAPNNKIHLGTVLVDSYVWHFFTDPHPLHN